MAIDSNQFKNQSVRDLAWAVTSPPLITQLSHCCVWPESRWYQYIAEETLSWLYAVDSDPAELDELLAGQNDRRLGRYFETLWLYWLRHNKRYQIIENNLQIIIDGETLGEIDFIVFDRVTKKTAHWELAVKFYLGIGDTREMSSWHGPNLHDQLDIKVAHLLHRQSLITKDQRVAKWLKQSGVDIDECAVILKGRLYYPWLVTPRGEPGGSLTSAMSPPQCAPDHLKSWWLRLSQIDDAFGSKQCFVPLINKGWLEKIPTVNEIQPITKKFLFYSINNNKVRLPLHVQLDKPQHSWDRVFLVGENWADEIT
jgi:uncharacterized protein